MTNLDEIRYVILNNGLTLLTEESLLNIEFCIRNAIAENVPGDFIETGVWKGGGVIYGHAVLKELGSSKRTFVADSFEGLPKPSDTLYPADIGDQHWKDTRLAVNLETVKNNFASLGQLDDKVVFLKGWFKDTLSTSEIDKLCVLRLDGDMYESTMDALVSLYPKLSIGGYCIIDDYSHPACIQAVEDYRKQHDILEEMKAIDSSWEEETRVWWKKTSSG